MNKILKIKCPILKGSMSVIELTGSTSVIFVDTTAVQTTVLLPPINFQSRFITIKDSTGNASNNPITVSTTSNYFFNGTGYTNQNGSNIAAVSTITINQNYASVTVSSAIPNRLNPSTTWILQNTYAFEDRYPIAQLDTLNCSNGNFSTISTINFQALNFQAASNSILNSQILSASISSLNVSDWLQVGNFLYTIPSTSSIGIGAYPSAGWALDVAFDARIRSTLSVQQGLFVGSSNLYAALGRVGVQCNAPRYTLDVAGPTFISGDLLVGSTFSVRSGRTTVGNSTPGAYLDVYGDALVRSSLTVASTFFVGRGQSTLGVGLNSLYINGPLLLNASLGPETLLISTSGIGTMFQMGSNGQTANLYFTGVNQGPTNAYMSFLSSGQLGVNCNFPRTYLDVGGSALINGNLNVTSSISTFVISSGKAYVGDYVGSTMQIGDSAYINVLSSGMTFISNLSAGYAYVGSLSSAQTAIGIISVGQGYIGALNNMWFSSGNISVGQGYVGTLSNESFSSLMISVGQSYINSMTAFSLSNNLQSTGAAFTGILTALSVNTSTLNTYSAVFDNAMGVSLNTLTTSTFSIAANVGNIKDLYVSSIQVGLNDDNNALNVTGNALITKTLTTSNLIVKNQTTLNSNVDINGNIEFIAAATRRTFTVDNTYSTLMYGAAGNVAFGIGTSTPRAGLDVQTEAYIAAANIGLLSAGSILIEGLTTGTLVGCNSGVDSLISYGTSKLLKEIEVGIDTTGSNIFHNPTLFVSEVDMNYLSCGSAYIGTLSTNNISAGNIIEQFSTFSSIIFQNFSTLSSYIKSGEGLSGVPQFISCLTISTGSAYIGTLSSASIFTTYLSSRLAYISSLSTANIATNRLYTTYFSFGVQII